MTLISTILIQAIDSQVSFWMFNYSAPKESEIRWVDDNLFGLLTGSEFDLLVHVPEECKPNDEGKLDCVGAKKGIKIGITQQYLGRHIYIHS
jgi:hypothetical protein